VPDRNAEYLAKLRNAEAMAAQFAEGSFSRESWLNIAEGYRDLLRPSAEHGTSNDERREPKG